MSNLHKQFKLGLSVWVHILKLVSEYFVPSPTKWAGSETELEAEFQVAAIFIIKRNYTKVIGLLKVAREHYKIERPDLANWPTNPSEYYMLHKCSYCLLLSRFGLKLQLLYPMQVFM